MVSERRATPIHIISLLLQLSAVPGQRETKAAVEQNGIFVHHWL